MKRLLHRVDPSYHSDGILSGRSTHDISYQVSEDVDDVLGFIFDTALWTSIHLENEYEGPQLDD